ncbi:MAG TPA: hypothetical protein VIZ32_01970, partial [Vicinamibacterales bacterium]
AGCRERAEAKKRAAIDVHHGVLLVRRGRKTVRIVTWQKTHAQSIQNFAWLPITPGENLQKRLRPRS